MCENAFRVKGYFNTHLMNHTGEKPYQGNQVEKGLSKLCKLKTNCGHTLKKIHIITTCMTKLYNSIILKPSKSTHWVESYKFHLCDKAIHVYYIEMLPDIFQTKNKQSLNKFLINPLIRA